MKILVALLVVLCVSHFSLLAQKEIFYLNPPSQLGDGYALELNDIVSTEAVCKLKVLVKNLNADAFLVYRLENSGFSFDNLGKFYERKQKGEVIAPYGKDAFVVKVTGNDFRKPTFTFHPEGLYMASMNVASVQPSAISLKIGGTEKLNSDDVTINLVSVVDKKGTIQVTLEIGLNERAKDKLLILDPTQLELVTADGLAVVSDLKSNKMRGLQAGETRKISFNYTSDQVVLIKWNNTFKVSPLILLETDPVVLVDKATSSTSSVSKASEGKTSGISTSASTTSAAITEVVKCPTYAAQQNGIVQVNVQATNGVCFKLDINGFPIVTEFSSSATFKVNQGRQKMVFTFMDGTTVEESSIINDWYSSIGYNIIKKKNGSHVVRYDVFAQVLSPTGEQQRSAMMASANSASNSSASSHGGSTTNSATACFGDATTGASSVRLKITWNGMPVANQSVRISQSGKVVGIGNTDANGVAKIYVTGLSSPKIDVEGCSGSKSWSVSGSFCVLDSSNNLDLPLDQIAREMAKLFGVAYEEIGSSWGF